MSKDFINPVKWSKRTELTLAIYSLLLFQNYVKIKVECWGVLYWGANWGVCEVNSPQLKSRGWFKSCDLESEEGLRSCTRVHPNKTSRELNPRCG